MCKHCNRQQCQTDIDQDVEHLDECEESITIETHSIEEVPCIRDLALENESQDCIDCPNDCGNGDYRTENSMGRYRTERPN